MCGIVGYVGARPCEEILVAGLEKLEYRGYDSAGVAMLIPGGIEKVRAVGNLAKLKEALEVAERQGLVPAPDENGEFGSRLSL